jgi:hypothetical protein
MEREPDGGLRRVRPLDAVAPARRDQNMIARPQREGRGVALEAEARAAAEQQNPLGPILVVPAAGRRRVAHGHYPLETKSRRLEQHLDELLAGRRRRIAEQVLDAAENSRR